MTKQQPSTTSSTEQERRAFFRIVAYTLLTLREEGKSTREIAHLFGVSEEDAMLRSSIVEARLRKVKRLGYAKKDKFLFVIMPAALLAYLRKQGLDTKDVARFFEVSEKDVARRDRLMMRGRKASFANRHSALDR